MCARIPSAAQLSESSLASRYGAALLCLTKCLHVRGLSLQHSSWSAESRMLAPYNYMDAAVRRDQDCTLSQLRLDLPQTRDEGRFRT